MDVGVVIGITAIIGTVGLIVLIQWDRRKVGRILAADNRDSCRCCLIGCDAPAAVWVQGPTWACDDYTYACPDHVDDLLGTGAVGLFLIDRDGRPGREITLHDPAGPGWDEGRNLVTLTPADAQRLAEDSL